MKDGGKDIQDIHRLTKSGWAPRLSVWPTRNASDLTEILNGFLELQWDVTKEQYENFWKCRPHWQGELVPISILKDKVLDFMTP